MRYKYLSTKFGYNVILLISIGLSAIYIVLLSLVAHNSDNIKLLIVLLSISPLVSYSLYEKAAKYIYASIDKWNKTLIFGNYFFKQEASLKQISIVKKRFFSKSTYKVSIGNNTYFIFTNGLNLEEELKEEIESTSKT